MNNERISLSTAAVEPFPFFLDHNHICFDHLLDKLIEARFVMPAELVACLCGVIE